MEGLAWLLAALRLKQLMESRCFVLDMGSQVRGVILTLCEAGCPGPWQPGDTDPRISKARGNQGGQSHSDSVLPATRLRQQRMRAERRLTKRTPAQSIMCGPSLRGRPQLKPRPRPPAREDSGPPAERQHKRQRDLGRSVARDFSRTVSGPWCRSCGGFEADQALVSDRSVDTDASSPVRLDAGRRRTRAYCVLRGRMMASLPRPSQHGR